MPRTAPWSLDETLTFLEAARTGPLKAAFVLAVALGLRRREILGLQWKDVAPDRRARVIPIPLMCVASLRWQRLRQADGRAGGVSGGTAAGPLARHPPRMRIAAVRGRRRAPNRHGDPGALADRGGGPR